MTRSSAQMERVGVATVAGLFSEMGWAFREQSVADHGIDALVEVDGLTAPTGRYLAVQIKCGPSYLNRKTQDGWRFHGKPRHLDYWLAHLMPVVLAIVDPDTRLAYWVHVMPSAVHFTDRGWSIDVPASNVLSTQSDSALRAIACAVAPANADPVEEALPLLPPSVIEMLSALRPVDGDGALRLARFLGQGGSQPRATVEALLDVSRSWPSATGLRLATIGAYANDHGHRDLAITAFALAADRDPTNGTRLSGIAGLLALAAGDRLRAADLLRPVRERAGVSLLADVAVCAFDADEPGRNEALETFLRNVPDDQLDAEPTCLLFLAERAFSHGNLDQALTLYERTSRRHRSIIGGRLGRARVLIERMLRGRSALPARDQQEAVELATAVRDDLRRWGGPSEDAHRLLVHERMLAGAFKEVIALATPTAFGGRANDREAIDPNVAILGAQASIALGDRNRAGRFADAMRGTPAESLIRALTADSSEPQATIALWRAAADNADTAFAARICLHQLALRGALGLADLDWLGSLANLDLEDRAIYAARNTAAAGDLDAAVTLLRSQRTPAAAEVLIETLREAGRYDEALAACDGMWGAFGALKALQEKVNILAMHGDVDAADSCAIELLATGELAAEQRRHLHRRLIQRRVMQADWAGAEACCRAALKDQPGDHHHAWALIVSQLNQDRWDAAWASYQQLMPEVHDAAMVPAWVDLHLRFGITQQTRAAHQVLIERFACEPRALARLASLDASPL